MAEDRKLIACVCTANVCRSPMAEALLRHALEAEGSPLSELEVVSAGISAFDGDPASDNSVKAMQRAGLNIKNHRSRRMSPYLINDSLLILPMTRSHEEVLLDLYPEAKNRIFLFRHFMGTGSIQIPDPFGSSLDNYIATRDAMVEAIPSLVAHIKTLVS